MEENNGRQNEENREELLEELQKLRSEVKRLNDKMAQMEGAIQGEPSNKSAQEEEPDSEPFEQELYRYVPPVYEQSSHGQSSHKQTLYEQSAYQRFPDEKSPHERPAHGQSPRERPAHGQSPYGQHSYGQSSYNQPLYGQSRYKRPSHGQSPGEPQSSRRRASVIPEMRRQRRENRAGRGVYQFGEMDVGKYGTAFLAAVCILAGCGLLMVSAWALADELVQAVLMFGLGIGMAGCGWLLHRSGRSSAVPTTLAACGLGILYMDCVALHFLRHLVSIEWVLPCILVWAVLSFYMAASGGTVLFYYVVNLGNLATAILVSSQGEGITEKWAGLLFTVAAYGFTLFQVFRIGVVRADGEDGKTGGGGLFDAGMTMGVRADAVGRTQAAGALWRTGGIAEARGTVEARRTAEAGETAGVSGTVKAGQTAEYGRPEKAQALQISGSPAQRKLRWLKNFTAVNVLAAYTILFAGEDSVPLLLFALVFGGIVLLFWRDLYQGGVKEEAAGVFLTECQMAVFCTRLTELLGRWEGAVIGSIVLLLLLAPLLRARNRDVTSAWILYPMLWVGIALSDLLAGSIYPVPYLILAAYYFYMLLYPAFCKTVAFVPAYIVMYLLLIGETSHPEVDITFALMVMFALGLPVKYLVKMMSGLSLDGQSLNGHLVDGQLVNGQPMNGQFVSGQPMNGRLVSGYPVNGQPVSGQPINEKSGFGADTAILTFRQVSRYGVAMLAAFVVCVTYCADFEPPFVLLVEAAMLAVFAGLTLWMESRDYRFFPVLCVGMSLLWVMSWRTLEWCKGDGIGLELAAGVLYLLAGSLAAWCGIRCQGRHKGRHKLNDPAQFLMRCPPGVSAEFILRRLNRYGQVFCPVSLGMFSLSLYRLVLVFRIPYGIFVSLILLAAAVGILLLGFLLSGRQIRAYALFLMFVCVVKMVTADLAGTGWVYRAVALAGGGVLCMVVSFIYSYMEHREKGRQKEQAGEH